MPTAARSSSANHSVRCSDQTWEAAKQRAESEGWAMNRAVTELLEGYAAGKVKLPKIVRVYPSDSADSVA